MEDMCHKGWVWSFRKHMTGTLSFCLVPVDQDLKLSRAMAVIMFLSIMIMMGPFELASKTKIINFIYKSSLAHDVSSQQLNNDQDNGKFINRLF